MLSALTGVALLATGAAPMPGQAGERPRPARPNFLVIVADDLGWSDLGAFGGEIRTPHLDALAYRGVRFTDLHTAPTCSPTRAMLLTGVDNHEVGLGSMAELLTPEQRGRPGYEGYLNRRAATIAESLRADGYRTLMAGKWHLGLEADQSPAARGFERSFALLQGAHNLYGADQSEAWQAAGAAARYREDGRPVTYPEGAYATDYFADRMIDYLEEGQGDQRPFFAYLTFTAPHWPMQAPAQDIARYRGRYDAGPEALRQERLRRQRRMGLIEPSAKAYPPAGVPDWASLSDEERALEARKMEVYAAMVDRLDQNVGRVIAELRRLGRLENTLVIFLADNGPEATRVEAPTLRDPSLLPTLGIDNSLDNIGRPTSYASYGPGWAQANSAPSRYFKGYETEGGTRVVGFAAGAGVRGGHISGAFLHVTDIAPTLLDLAGDRGGARHRGAPLRPEGSSWARLLRGGRDAVRDPSETLSGELFFRRAVRRGDWKAVYLPGDPLVPYRIDAAQPARWELYDLKRDPGETTDLADRHPRLLRGLVRAWRDYADRVGVVLPPAAAQPAGAP